MLELPRCSSSESGIGWAQVIVHAHSVPCRRWARDNAHAAVRSRFGRGSVAVRSRFGRGSTPVRRTIPKVELTKAHFDGTCVVLTGDLNLVHAASNRPLSRKLANELAAAARVEVASEVSSTVDYLVCAAVDSASQEAQHARRKRIPIVSEREFWEVLGIATRSG